ncbi:MAG: DUF1566 domain-containing protein [Legionella sp.]|nr:DUF1566 domain-containing protein [Legionella sp.]
MTLLVELYPSKVPCLGENAFMSCLGGFANDNYWSSTESTDNPANNAWNQNFNNGDQNEDNKNNTNRVRCVRGFKQNYVITGVGT